MFICPHRMDKLRILWFNQGVVTPYHWGSGGWSWAYCLNCKRDVAWRTVW